MCMQTKAHVLSRAHMHERGDPEQRNQQRNGEELERGDEGLVGARHHGGRAAGFTSRTAM
jgi:hypothetical protein